jgi:sulfonate transport system substrate-binding protein
MTSDLRFSSSRRTVLRTGMALAAVASGPTFAADAKTLRIGFQKGGGLLGVLKTQGHLEKKLHDAGWGLSWYEFPAGPQLLEALSAGSVDFGYTGAPPPIFAQAAAKDVIYVGAEPTGPSAEAIVVKPDSPYKTVTDLRGKRIAVQKGSSANFLLLAALSNANIAFTDIQPIYLAPADARAAFESANVDAWAIWDPYLAAVQSTLKVRVVADYTGLLHTNSFYESSRTFAARAPDTIALVLEELSRTGAWASANPAAVAEQLAPELGLPAAVVETWQRRTRYGVQPVDSTVVATQQKVADAFFEHKLIPKQIDVSSAVWQWVRG